MGRPKRNQEEILGENSEQSQSVETMEEVENVAPEELEALDEHLNQPENPSDSIVKQAMAEQQTGFRTIQEIEADLKKPIPSQFIKTLTVGPARGKKYIPWIIVQRILSYYAPGWSTCSTGFSTPIGTAIITELTIPTATGPVTRAGHGFEPHQTKNRDGQVKDTGFGGAPVVASAQAFKRSSVAFGLGRDLYPV